MPNTYTLISSNVFGSSAASFTFSAIPSTYTDLVVRVSTRLDSTASNYPSIMSVKYNGDGTTTLYSNTYVYGQDATSGSFNESSTTRTGAYGSNSGISTSNTFSNIEMYIPSYGISQNKPLSVFGVAEINDANFSIVAASASLYRNTATISSISFSTVSGANFVAGSSFYLYGISKS
jgi:hypothetical protein